MDITNAFLLTLRHVQSIEKDAASLLSEDRILGATTMNLATTTTTSGGGRNTPMLVVARPRLTASNPFTQQAREVVLSLKEKEKMLSRCRADYVDIYRYIPSRASAMDDFERDEIDKVMTSFIVKCGSQIEILRCLAAENEDNGPVSLHPNNVAHRTSMVTYLGERLQALSQTFQGMQSQRQSLSQFSSKHRLYQLGATPSAPTTSGDANSSKGGLTSMFLRGSDKQKKAGGIVRTRYEEEEEKHVAQRLAESAVDDPRKKLMMEQENGELASVLQSELDDVRQMETRMVELSQLVGLFAGKLMEQQEVVEDILDSAVGTAINVDQGNDELMTAYQRSRKASYTFVTFVTVMSFLLLLMDFFMP